MPIWSTILLVSAVLKDTSTSTILKNYVYSYDKASNRTSEQIDNSVTKVVPNNVNQMTAHVGTGGPVKIKGHVNEEATVSVNGINATMSSNITYESSLICHLKPIV
jgi:hypothetical protein